MRPKTLKSHRLATASLGLAVGLGILVREGSVVFLGVWTLTVLLVFRERAWRQGLKSAGALAVVAILTLCPWWIRNWRVFFDLLCPREIKQRS